MSSTTPEHVSASAAAAPAGKTGHPRGLYTIFMTEMWERFSYYGMRGLLVLYLVNALHYDRADALALYGIYTSLVYLTPMFGGALADKYLGGRRAAIIGGAVMMLGHLAMAFEPLLNLALGLLIIGNGFFKPNTTTMVGELYDGENDPRRAGGYSIFYMGINLGAFLAPFVAGTLGEKVGWHWGFGAAAVGMAFGLTQFVLGQKHLGRAGLKAHQDAVTAKDVPQIAMWTIGATVSVYLAIFAWGFIGPVWAGLSGPVKMLLGTSVIGASLFMIARPDPNHPAPALTRQDYGRVFGIIVAMIFVIVFWTGFEQAGGTMNLFADKQTDRTLGFAGIDIVPATWFQAVNPIAIVIFAPLFSILWTKLDQSRYALPDIAKQGVGMVVLGLGFLVMAHADTLAKAGLVGMHWLVIVYVIHTLAELAVSPVGLSMVSRLAPARIAALLMGVWFLSSAAANYVAAVLEHWLEGSSMGLYDFLAWLAIGAGALLLVITPVLSRIMGLKKA